MASCSESLTTFLPFVPSSAPCEMGVPAGVPMSTGQCLRPQASVFRGVLRLLQWPGKGYLQSVLFLFPYLFPKLGSGVTLNLGSRRATELSAHKASQGCCDGKAAVVSVKTVACKRLGFLQMAYRPMRVVASKLFAETLLKHIRCDSFPEAWVPGLMCWHSERPVTFLIIHQVPNNLPWSY